MPGSGTDFKKPSKTIRRDIVKRINRQMTDSARRRKILRRNARLRTAAARVTVTSDEITISMPGRRIRTIGLTKMSKKEKMTSYIKDLSAGKNPNYLPVRIYITDESLDTYFKIKESINKIVELLGCKLDDDFDIIRGSFFQEIVAFVRRNKHEIDKRLEKVEKAIENQVYGKNQAIIDEGEANAVSSLLKGLENTDQAAIQLGSLLLLKQKDGSGRTSVLSIQLTVAQLKIIERDPSVLKNPSETLRLLYKDDHAPITIEENQKRIEQISNL